MTNKKCPTTLPTENGSDGQPNGGHYYENSAAVLARLNDGDKPSGMGDYIPMEPRMFQARPEPEMPLIPFEPLKYDHKNGDLVSVLKNFLRPFIEEFAGAYPS